MCNESQDYFVYPGTTPDFLGFIPRFCRSKSCVEYTVCVDGWVDPCGWVVMVRYVGWSVCVGVSGTMGGSVCVYG